MKPQLAFQIFSTIALTLAGGVTSHALDSKTSADVMHACLASYNVCFEACDEEYKHNSAGKNPLVPAEGAASLARMCIDSCSEHHRNCINSVSRQGVVGKGKPRTGIGILAPD